MNHKPYENTNTITPDQWPYLYENIDKQRVSRTAHCIQKHRYKHKYARLLYLQIWIYLPHSLFHCAFQRISRFSCEIYFDFSSEFGLHVEYFNVLYSPTTHRVSIPARFISAFYLEPCYVHGPLSFVNVVVFYNQHHLFWGILLKTSSWATVCDVKPTAIKSWYCCYFSFSAF